jgi:hypothetical protein
LILYIPITNFEVYKSTQAQISELGFVVNKL